MGRSVEEHVEKAKEGEEFRRENEKEDLEARRTKELRAGGEDPKDKRVTQPARVPPHELEEGELQQAEIYPKPPIAPEPVSYEPKGGDADPYEKK